MNITKYYVISENDIFCFKNLKKLNNTLKTQFDKNDFKRIGSDFILFITDTDIVYQRDLHYLSQIPIQNLYKTDKRPLLFLVLNLIFTLFAFIQIVSTRGYVSQIVKLLGG